MTPEDGALAGRARRLAILGCRGIPARYGGFETFAEELAVRLVARGLSVTVFCQQPERGDAPRQHRGVRLEHVRVPRLGPASALLYDVLALRRARDHDVVYMLGYGAGPFLGLARRGGNEVWVNMDGLEWRRSKWGLFSRGWLRRAERAALRSAQRVVFDSAAVRAAVLGEEPAPELAERACVIEYGADLELADDPGVLAGLGLHPGDYFLCVARVEPENHVLEILRAHARSGVGRALLVVGDLERAGRYGAACRSAATRTARFLGPLFDRRTLHALRRGAAAALHGHSVGGTNPALLEAMAAGVPLVAHDNPFNREVLAGRALWFRGEDELVAALRAADAWSGAERARRGAEQRARIAERYTWERIAEEYAALLARPAPRRGAAQVDDVPAALPRAVEDRQAQSRERAP
jgi:glycosyltransferase involved in cell wall biosynthesis